jgi:hypothetical protein
MLNYDFTKRLTVFLKNVFQITRFKIIIFKSHVLKLQTQEDPNAKESKGKKKSYNLVFNVLTDGSTQNLH